VSRVPQLPLTGPTAPLLALAWLVAILIATPPASAQTTAENLAKYHALRARLLTEFSVPGDAPGESQVADVRDDGEGFIKWADSTIRLGWYIGVLATEHHLYENPELYPGALPFAPEATLDELHDALLALERLDRVADAAFPPPCTQGESLNGFFLRDDVPEGFHSHFPPATTTYSDFVDPVPTNKEMSQDQVYHLLIGLALVKVFVPPEVSVKGRALRPWAVEQAQRILSHVSADDWIVMNPACDRPVNRGESAGGYSAGTREAIGFITDGSYRPEVLDVWIDVWAQARDPAFIGYLDIDNRHMALAIAAVGDGWGATTAEDLATLGEEPAWPFYALLHRALHGDAAVGWCRTGASVNAGARGMLDELPDGADIASPWPAGPGVHGFTRSNRFMRGAETAYTGEEGSDGYRYNGLDYLLLHNLYAVATPATWEGGSGPGIPACPAPDAGAPADAGEDGGCSCRVARTRGNAVSFALAAVAWLVRRRLRQRRQRCGRAQDTRHASSG
jgi:hypothetical protein